MNVFLGVTDFPSAKEALLDYYVHSKNKQKILFGMGSTIPPFLWMGLFLDSKKLVLNNWDDDGNDILEEDEENDLYPGLFQVPFLEKNKAIENLKKSEPNVSKYFSEHGGVKAIVNDMIELIEADSMKYIYIDPCCADNCFDDDYYTKSINRSLEICKGNMNIDKDLLQRDYEFSLLDEDSKHRQFKSRADIPNIHTDDISEYDGFSSDDCHASYNYLALVGCYDSDW